MRRATSGLGALRLLKIGGAEFDAAPGHGTHLPHGHDAWVVGHQPLLVDRWPPSAQGPKAVRPGKALE
jgi:hypothetical protein